MNAPLVLPPQSRLHGLTQAAIQHVIATAQALERGDATEADRRIAGLLALYPDHPEVLRLAAGASSLHGDYAQAALTMQRAVALRPHDALYHNTLGTALSDAGDYDAAIAALHEATALDPKLALAWFNLGLAMTRSMRVAEAAVALRRAVELAPEHANARVMLGDMLRASGHANEAVAEYRRVLARDPRAGMAWWGLADIKTLRFGDDDVARMREVLRQGQANDSDLVATGFALAKALDERREYAASLDTLASANTRARRHRQWDAGTHAAAVDAVLSAFARPPARADSTLGHEAIFIASLPRSGSTLIEQILASHSQVDGAGELPDLPAVLTEESQRRSMPFPHWVPAMHVADWQRLGERYLARTAHWRTRRPRFTDKLPYNWFYIGAIRAMLPGASIIIARRDPLETCFSCYRQHLAHNEYTRTFADLAAFWRDFDRATKHWRALHPAHVYESVYEELVADLETHIRALLEFCELPFETACLEFHTTRREVHTPSAMQVREPLRRDTARGDRYGALLDPLRAELGLPLFASRNG